MSTSLHWKGSSYAIRMSRLNLVQHVLSLDKLLVVYKILEPNWMLSHMIGWFGPHMDHI